MRHGVFRKALVILAMAIGCLAFEARAEDLLPAASEKIVISFPLPSETTFEGKEYINEVIAKSFLQTGLSTFIRAPHTSPTYLNSLEEDKVVCLLDIFSEVSRWGADPHIYRNRRESIFKPDSF